MISDRFLAFLFASDQGLTSLFLQYFPVQSFFRLTVNQPQRFAANLLDFEPG